MRIYCRLLGIQKSKFCSWWCMCWTHSTISMQVQNLILEVLLANLMVTQSVRVTVGYTFALVLMPYFGYLVGQWMFLRNFDAACMMLLYIFSLYQEICLGIMGNLACHEVPMKHIVSTNGLISVIVDQLFLDDTQCLGEAFR